MKSWLEEQYKKILKWPSQSSDLNSIENLWSEIEKRIEAKKPKNADEFWQNIEICWKAIPPSLCRHLIESLPNRCVLTLTKTKVTPPKY